MRIGPGSLASKDANAVFLAPTTFKELDLKEEHLETFVRDHPEILFPEDDDPTFLIVGQQVQNALGDRADLVGLLPCGELVVVEVKRDAADMTARREPLEWQAVRYASSVATIKSVDDLVDRLYAPYLLEHGDHTQWAGKSVHDYARSRLEDFLENPDPSHSHGFNEFQQIILVASDFDDRTMAACSWLVKNELPLSCVSLKPHPTGTGEALLEARTVLPPPALEEWFVEIGRRAATPRARPGQASRGKGLTMKDLFDAGILKSGDELYVNADPTRSAKLLDPDTVEFEGKKLSPTQWGMEVTGWSAFGVYQSAFVKGRNVKLGRLRDDLAEKRKSEAAARPITAEEPVQRGEGTESEPRLRIGETIVTPETIRVRIHNDGPGTARGCYGKVTIDNSADDLDLGGNTSSFPVFINSRQGEVGITRGSVAWARSPNPPNLDVGPSDDESLMIARLLPVSQETHIEIPSEEGFSVQREVSRSGEVLTPPRRARAFLKPRGRPYAVTIRVGAQNVSEPVERTIHVNADPGKRALTCEESSPSR